MSDYQKGFRDGFEAGYNNAVGNQIELATKDFIPSYGESRLEPKRKRRQSPKQKLLKQMTDKKWKVYKRGSGKKTYIQIRGEVSRSQLYKKKAKKL